jgi:hypothetical protein
MSKLYIVVKFDFSMKGMFFKDEVSALGSNISI